MASRMEFDCKLAHNEEIKRVANFKSIRELHDQVSKLFHISADEILYFTLNTHNFRDMEAILGNYLSYGDIIVVHTCGQSKDLHLTKTQEFLGLTITDNGHGRAFVKKVKSDQQAVEANIKQGDHIAAINSESTIGMRHYEVAKAIRMVPKGTNFTIRLVEPKYSDKYFNMEQNSTNGPVAKQYPDRLNQAGNLGRNMHANHQATSPGADLFTNELIHSSLPIDKLLSKRALATGNSSFFCDNETEFVHNSRISSQIHGTYKATIDKINSILESFLGINDNLLAIQIYRLARENKDSYDKYLGAIEISELSAFNFSDDMKKYLWRCATSQTIPK